MLPKHFLKCSDQVRIQKWTPYHDTTWYCSSINQSATDKKGRSMPSGVWNRSAEGYKRRRFWQILILMRYAYCRLLAFRCAPPCNFSLSPFPRTSPYYIIGPSHHLYSSATTSASSTVLPFLFTRCHYLIVGSLKQIAGPTLRIRRPSGMNHHLSFLGHYLRSNLPLLSTPQVRLYIHSLINNSVFLT